MARAVLVGPVAPYLAGKDYTMRVGFAPGECPHALVVWQTVLNARHVPTMRPVQVRCKVDHGGLSRDVEHAGAGRRWR